MSTEEIKIEIKHEPLIGDGQIDTKPQFEPDLKSPEEVLFMKSENLDVKCEGEEEELDDPLHFELENCQNSNVVASVQNQPTVQLRRLKPDLLNQLDDNLLVDLNSTSKEFLNTEEIALPNKRFSKERQLDEEKNGSVYKCSYCDSKYSVKSDLRKHLTVHHSTGQRFNKLQPFQCPDCNYSSRYKNRLKVHLTIHSDKKPYQCPHCDYSGKRKVNLESHLLVHSEEKPFECMLCNYSCKRRMDLKSHLQLIHCEEKPFQCSKCDYSSKRKMDLESHFLVHNTNADRETEKVNRRKFFSFLLRG